MPPLEEESPKPTQSDTQPTQSGDMPTQSSGQPTQSLEPDIAVPDTPERQIAKRDHTPTTSERQKKKTRSASPKRQDQRETQREEHSESGTSVNTLFSEVNRAHKASKRAEKKKKAQAFAEGEVPGPEPACLPEPRTLHFAIGTPRKDKGEQEMYQSPRQQQPPMASSANPVLQAMQPECQDVSMEPQDEPQPLQVPSQEPHSLGPVRQAAARAASRRTSRSSSSSSYESSSSKGASIPSSPCGTQSRESSIASTTHRAAETSTQQASTPTPEATQAATTSIPKQASKQLYPAPRKESSPPHSRSASSQALPTTAAAAVAAEQEAAVAHMQVDVQVEQTNRQERPQEFQQQAQRAVDIFGPHIEPLVHELIAKSTEALSTQLGQMQEDISELQDESSSHNIAINANEQALVQQQRQQAAAEIVASGFKGGMNKEDKLKAVDWILGQTGVQEYSTRVSGSVVIVHLTHPWQRGRILGWSKGKPITVPTADRSQLQVLLRAQISPHDKILQQPLRTCLTIMHTSENQHTKQRARECKVRWEDLRAETILSTGETVTLVQIVYERSPSRMCTVYAHNKAYDEISDRFTQEMPSAKKEMAEYTSSRQYITGDRQSTFPYTVTIKPWSDLPKEHPRLFEMIREEQEQRQTEGKEGKGKGQGKSKGTQQQGQETNKGKGKGKGKGYQNRSWYNPEWQPAQWHTAGEYQQAHTQGTSVSSGSATQW